MKSVRIRSFSGPSFPAFGLNTERYYYLSVFNPNAGKNGQKKLGIRDTFNAVPIGKFDKNHNIKEDKSKYLTDKALEKFN